MEMIRLTISLVYTSKERYITPQYKVLANFSHGPFYPCANLLPFLSFDLKQLSHCSSRLINRWINHWINHQRIVIGKSWVNTTIFQVTKRFTSIYFLKRLSDFRIKHIFLVSSAFCLIEAMIVSLQWRRVPSQFAGHKTTMTCG